MEKQIIFPVNTKHLEFFLPHRAPMKWVDEVISLDEGNDSGITKLHLKESELYFDHEDDQLFPSAFLEIMGQSFGYIKAISALINKRRLKMAYLAAVDSFNFKYESLPKAGEQITTHVQEKNNLYPIF